VITLLCQSLNSSSAKDEKRDKGIVDGDFLKNINQLKSQMIREGSEFKNVALKFISKTNRYVIANENIKVKYYYFYFADHNFSFLKKIKLNFLFYSNLFYSI